MKSFVANIRGCLERRKIRAISVSTKVLSMELKITYEDDINKIFERLTFNLNIALINVKKTTREVTVLRISHSKRGFPFKMGTKNDPAYVFIMYNRNWEQMSYAKLMVFPYLCFLL